MKNKYLTLLLILLVFVMPVFMWACEKTQVEKVYYTLTVKYNNETNQDQIIKAEKDTQIGIEQINIPENEGYTFNGFFSDINCTTTVDFPIKLDKDGITIYIDWKEILEYTVRFLDYDGTVLKTQQVINGQSATPPSNPTKESTIDFDYAFAGWDKAYNYITGNLDITATYTSTPKTYAARFLNYDGTVLKSEQVNYGNNATPPNNPTKASTTEYIK